MIAIIISVILFVATIALAVLGVINKTKPMIFWCSCLRSCICTCTGC